MIGMAPAGRLQFPAVLDKMTPPPPPLLLLLMFLFTPTLVSGQRQWPFSGPICQKEANFTFSDQPSVQRHGTTGFFNVSWDGITENHNCSDWFYVQWWREEQNQNTRGQTTSYVSNGDFNMTMDVRKEPSRKEYIFQVVTTMFIRQYLIPIRWWH
jgi:hypothetical protein